MELAYSELAESSRPHSAFPPRFFLKQGYLKLHAFSDDCLLEVLTLTKVKNPLSHEEVEGYFEGELSKK